MTTCKHCGKELTRKRFNGRLEDRAAFNRRIYCDRECMAAGYEGTIKIPTPRNSRRQSQKARTAQCDVCTRSDSRLYMHHRDENPMNNDPANLQTLCGSCHRLSHSPNYTGTPLQPKPCAHCSRPVARQGLCNTHLTRLKRSGDPLMRKIKIGSEWVLRRASW